MKKLIAEIFILIVTVFTVNAQVFVGGDLGLNFGDVKNSYSYCEDFTSEFGFRISPQVGYYLNDDLAIGVSGHIDKNRSNLKIDFFLPVEGKDKTVSESWGVNVFGRYKLMGLGIENLSLWVEGSAGVSENSVKGLTTEGMQKKLEGTVYDINVLPVLLYKLSDKIHVLAYCNFLTIGYSYQTQNNTELSVKSKNHNFNFGFNSFSNLSIGLIYKF